MIHPCRKCGGSPRLIKKNTLFTTRCCNDACENAVPLDKCFNTISFAYTYWNRIQSIGSDFELTEREDETNEGTYRKTNERSGGKI